MSFVRTLSATVFLTCLAISPVLAETFEVKMLNQGEKARWCSSRIFWH